jgi:hypothetical protein
MKVVLMLVIWTGKYRKYGLEKFDLFFLDHLSFQYTTLVFQLKTQLSKRYNWREIE